jgi:SAM-dependent methyltransferase
MFHLLHKLAANPFIYDAIQEAVGASIVRNNIKKQIDTHLKKQFCPKVLDLGGGTGLARKLFPADSKYISIDLDIQKLEGFQNKAVDGMALLGTITECPIKSQSIDLMLCCAVFHHLSNDLLPFVMQESMRVLKHDGTFIILDPVFAPQNLPGRILWSLDRGSYPRKLDVLLSTLDQYAQVMHWESFKILHRYFLCILRPK